MAIIKFSLYWGGGQRVCVCVCVKTNTKTEGEFVIDLLSQ